MTIEIKKNAAETIIEIVGRLDTITAPALDKTINEDLGDTKNLVLDVKGMEYIHSMLVKMLRLNMLKIIMVRAMAVVKI